MAKFDVLFAAVNTGNTTTPFVADFAVNSPLVRELLANNKAKVHIIVWENAELDSFQACDIDFTAGEHRILAVVNNPDLLNLKIPDIMNNRFGSVTYYSEPSNAGPGNAVRITVRFISFEETIRIIAPELVNGGISYVVSSQAANTGESDLAANREQAISDLIPPTLTVNSNALPVVLRASKHPSGEVGAILPTDLVTATKGEFENPAVTCMPIDLGQIAPLGNNDLTCEATAENTVMGSVSFTVIVEDQDPPVLGPMPANIVLEREMLDGTEIPASDYSLPVATDEIDANVLVTCSPISPGGPAPFDLLDHPTETKITCTATDDAGLMDSGSFSVTVQDTIPPVLTVPASAGAEAMRPTGASVAFVPDPSATDIVTPTVSCEIVVDSPVDPPVFVVSGSQFPIGTTTVSRTATDDAGLSTTAPPFVVTVADLTVEANSSTSASPRLAVDAPRLPVSDMLRYAPRAVLKSPFANALIAIGSQALK